MGAPRARHARTSAAPRRQAAATLALACLALPGGGCGTPPSPPPPLLRVGTPVDITRPSPFSPEGLGAAVLDLVFLPLSRDGWGGAVLAEPGWPRWSQGGSVATVRLRRGLHFADGSDVTASDVTDTLRRAKEHAVWGASELAEVVTVDEQTVALRPSRPFLWPALADVTGVARRGTDPPVGGGPYVVAAQDADHLRLERNPRFDGPAAALPAIEFRRFDSASDEWSGLLSGKVDLITYVPWNKFEQLSQIPSVRVHTTLSNLVVELTLRAPPPPFDRPEVRRALALLIDRDELVRTALRGQGVPARGVVWPGSPDFDGGLLPYEHAPEEAQRALLAAGCVRGDGGGLSWKGQPLRIDAVYWEGGPGLEMIALVLSRQLAQAGIQARFRGLGHREYRDRLQGAGSAAILGFRHAASDVLSDRETGLLGAAAPASELSSRTAVDQVVRLTQRRLRDEAPSIYLVWLNRLDVIDRRFCGLPGLADGPEGRLDAVHACAPGEEE